MRSNQDTIETSLRLRDVPRKVASDLRPLFTDGGPLGRVESYVGLASGSYTVYQFATGHVKEGLAGLAVCAVAGFYGAYKDGCFSSPREVPVKPNDTQ